MAQKSPSFSLIFVNYRSTRHLSRALESLFLFEDASQIELIVVNNDKEESSLLRKLQEAFRFSLIENEKNGGFGQGANLGASAASGPLLGFLNPDILWQNACLGEIVTLFDRDAHIGIAGMRLLGTSGKPEAWSFGKTPSLLGLLCNNFFSFSGISSKKTSPLPVGWVSGGALFIRKNIFQSIGGFDERFFLYFEDADLCLRTKKGGYKICLLPSVTLVHHGGKSCSSRESQKKYFYASQETYFKKHRPGWEYVFLRIFRFFRYGF